MVRARLPTENDTRIISTNEAKKLYGNGANRVQGVAVRGACIHSPRLYPKQYISGWSMTPSNCYYHWSVPTSHLAFGAHTRLSTPIFPTELPPPRKLIDAGHWRSISMEFSDDWKDRAAMDVPFVFDRVVFADRAAPMNGANFLCTQRTASEAFTLPGSPQTGARSGDRVHGLEREHRRRNPRQSSDHVHLCQDWGRRMLIQRDHEKLVEELYKLRDQYGYEVNVVSMDKLSPFEQLRLAGRTTVCTFYLPTRSGLKVDSTMTDHDGGARQWSDLAVVDEALAMLDSH